MSHTNPSLPGSPPGLEQGIASLPSGSQLEWCWIRHATPSHPVPVVMLHEGLGCISLWRDFPKKLAQELGRDVLVYSRRGYGRSSAWPGPWSSAFMHAEAHSELPELLKALEIRHYLLFGHSDGGSIALLHAARYPASALGVVCLAPHLFVEPICVHAIGETRSQYEAPASPLAAGLAKHHDHSQALFEAWSGIWLEPQFRAWTIEAELGAVSCPVLAIQGREDQYGTLAQIERLQARLPKGQCSLLVLDQCRHSPQLDQPEAVLATVDQWLGSPERLVDHLPDHLPE
jgi:pimeloyl-ACP methyl ester carboxylesterase